MRRTLGLVAAFSIVAVATHASDGVLEINQTCAVQTGCFAGDTAGFPVTISETGSYRLTGNLSLGSNAVMGIRIQAPNVELDLGGFTLRGTEACSGYPVTSCADAPGFAGISGDSTTSLASVRNGSVVGMGGPCISLLGASSVVEDVRVLTCADFGIHVGPAGRVARSFAGGAFASGIVFESGGSAIGNESRGNGGRGIHGGYASSGLGGSILENRVFDNREIGVDAVGPILVSRNVLVGNAGGPLSLTLSAQSLGDNLCSGARC